MTKGGQEVRIYCLEQRHEMPAFEDEVEAVEEEGIEIINGWGPATFHESKGRVTGVTFKSCTRVFDEQKRFRPQYDESVTIDDKADTVLVAIGQKTDPSFLENTNDVELTRWGTFGGCFACITACPAGANKGKQS